MMKFGHPVINRQSVTRGRDRITGHIITRMATTDPLVSLPDEQLITGNIDMEMATTDPLVSLPVEIFSSILEYLDWGDVGRLDTAFLNRETRDSYLSALQLRKVKVERNEFWGKALDREIFISWLIRRNIRVISWDIGVDNAQLISIANGLRQLQSLNIGYYRGNITDEGITAVANGLPQLQSLDISGCDKITDEGVRALASGLPQLQSLNIRGCYNITDAGIIALANGLPQLQSLNISGCCNVTGAGREIAERINSRR